ncbi:MAG: hypothetical protein M0R16_08950 [Bacteroidales bacterium]|jgi:hypothetical protein|nr:hypothetical protein [Bacteroidales bacterium]
MQDVISKRFLLIEKSKDTKKAINILKELYIIDSSRKYPSIPERLLSAPKYGDKTANGLTRCIIDFIRLSGGQAERINCTGRIIDSRKTSTDILGNQRTIGQLHYIKTAGQRGTADISATIQGRSVKIEVKIKNDRQSVAQKEYQQSIEASGGLYFIAKDFEQFITWYYFTFGRAEHER